MSELYDKIERYFEGSMSEEERQAFEKLLREDAAVAKAAKEFREVRAHFVNQFNGGKNETELLKTLQKLNGQFFVVDDKKQKNAKFFSINRRWWWGAAGIAAAIALILIFRSGQADLYHDYAGFPKAAFVEKGETNDILAAAENYFNTADYARALVELNVALKVRPESSELLFYKALCLLELENLPEARLIFDSLKQGNSAYREDALWFLALSYLRSEEPQKTMEQLRQIPPDGSHFSEAQELIERLQE
ncbi:MAG TPA: hypothetical protein PKC40_00880 [Saprospiraceae bacterium]|nr:hypothetical protein [Saprospiraceae bacterium]